MDDLRRRFASLDRVPAPSEWGEIEQRAELLRAETGMRVPTSRPQWRDGSASASSLARGGLRWSTALVLLLVMLALVAGAILVGARYLRHAPPTGVLGHLAYGLDGDVYLADWDGKNPVRIADGAPTSGPPECNSFWGEGPIWSPDGRHMAYRSDWNDVCQGSVYIADANGKLVSSFPASGWLIAWSPDSTRVGTWLDSPYESKTLAVYGVDGVRQAALDLPPDFRLSGDYDPFWSPDGRSLVFPHGIELPLDGSAPRRVAARDPRSYLNATYSPDGRRAAYVDNRTLYVTTTDGSDRRVLLPRIDDENTWLASPKWSPTGEQIAFETFLEAATEMGVASDIRIVDVATGAVAILDGAGDGAYLRLIKFSPKGDRLLYSRAEDSHVEALWTVSTDGSGIRELVHGSGWGDWQWLSVDS